MTLGAWIVDRISEGTEVRFEPVGSPESPHVSIRLVGSTWWHNREVPRSLLTDETALVAFLDTEVLDGLRRVEQGR